MYFELLWMLLPAAAVSGWFVARRNPTERTRAKTSKGLRSDYFKGINYLLNEQPDKAIEVFIQVLEVDSETVETHLALGNLYRRRGEVDRAIRIHQNLFARANLSDAQRSEALLELGQDYMSAGLLDRAENLFRELVEANTHSVQALRQLIDIYEQEKDWDEAIACARKLERATGNQLGGVIAHYYCEQAAKARQDGQKEACLALIEQALDSQKTCVRASLMLGDVLSEAGDHRAAVGAYRRVEEQDPDYLPEIVERIHQCARQLGECPEMIDYLARILDRYGGITATLTLTELKRQEHGTQAAMDFITEQLRRRPSVRGLDRFLELELGIAGEQPRDHLAILKELTTKLLEDRPVYKCLHCGFPAKSLHWQCPGCKHWNSIKPIQGVQGE